MGVLYCLLKLPPILEKPIRAGKESRKRKGSAKGKEKRSADLPKTKYLLQIVLKEDSCHYYLSLSHALEIFDDELPLKLLE